MNPGTTAAVIEAMDEWKRCVQAALVLTIQAEHTQDPGDHGNAAQAEHVEEIARQDLLVAIAEFTAQQADREAQRRLRRCWLQTKNLGEC